MGGAKSQARIKTLRRLPRLVRSKLDPPAPALPGAGDHPLDHGCSDSGAAQIPMDANAFNLRPPPPVMAQARNETQLQGCHNAAFDCPDYDLVIRVRGHGLEGSKMPRPGAGRLGGFRHRILSEKIENCREIRALRRPDLELVPGHNCSMHGWLRIVLLAPALLSAQVDPVFEAYDAWNRQHPMSDFQARTQSFLEVSADWVAKWPDNRSAWMWRRDAVLQSMSHSAELWKQVDEKLIALSPPHTFASLAAYDWVTAKVNVKDAEALLVSEIAWQDAQPKPDTTSGTLDRLIDEANWSSRSFGSLQTLASAQIQLKEFKEARATIARIQTWLEGDFVRYYDQDPLETVPDYQSKFYILSAELAQAERRNVDALAFYRSLITNPWYRREYGGYVQQTLALWTQTGGTEDGWNEFSKVEPLPPGAPAGNPGISFLPWVKVDYKLPEMEVPGMDSRTWTLKDFEGRKTLVYLWSTLCGSCWQHLPDIQALYDRIKDRRDIQIVTLSADEDPAKLAAFVKEKGYTFPVMMSKPYTEKILPKFMLGQQWMVDSTGSIRLQRTSNFFGGRPQAFIDESLYKLATLETPRP